MHQNQQTISEPRSEAGADPATPALEARHLFKVFGRRPDEVVRRLSEGADRGELAGLGTAAVIDVGTATLAAFIGAGGLGEPIVQGLALADSRMVLAGALPAAGLALVVDWGLGWVERAVAPAGRQ